MTASETVLDTALCVFDYSIWCTIVCHCKKTRARCGAKTVLLLCAESAAVAGSSAVWKCFCKFSTQGGSLS